MKKSLMLTFAVLLLLSANVSAEIKLKSLAKKKWTLVESDNFEIITDLPAKKAKLTAEQLEKYRAFCALWLNITPNENTSKMVMFLTKKSSTWKAMGIDENWVSLYSHREGIAPQMFVNVKGLFGRSFQNSNSGRAVVLNAIANDMFSNAGLDNKFPLWFRTGFGFYLATYAEPGDKVVLGSIAAYEHRIYSVFNAGGGMASFDSQELMLRKKNDRRIDSRSNPQRLRDLNRFYMHSFLIIHYLHSSNELRKQMFTYLRLVVSGVREEEAVKEAFSKSFEELDKDLRKYAAGSRLTARVMQKQQIESLLTLPESYQVSAIDDAIFFEYYAKALLELSESSVSNKDKQAFLKDYKKRYLIDKNAETKL
jgi:hypothetical protein